jgi:predicted permease
MPIDVRLDVPVLGFTAAVSVIAVALFGLVPAFRASRVDLVSTIRANAQSVTGTLGGRGQRMPLGKLLISAQVALSLVLLIGAALLSRSLRGVEHVDTGLDRDHLLIVEVDAVSRGHTEAKLVAFARDLAERLQQVPGIAGVTYSDNGIFSGTESATTIQIPGFVMRTQDDSVANSDAVGPGYVRTIGARLLQGRDIQPSDVASGAPVVLVNETMAKYYFGTKSPIGQTIRFDSTKVAQIVGVLADVRDHELTGTQERRFYFAYAQDVQGYPGNLRFEIRTQGDPAALATTVRRVIATYDPQLAIDAIDPLSRLMRQSIREARLLTKLASGFGALALVLAAVGLYGVMTYAVTRRTSEIGLRVALGARRGDVVGMVLGDALRLVLLGVIAGVPLALSATRLLRSQLHGIEPTDPLSIAIALAVLAASAFVASALPALRAARVAPIVALRQE